MKSIRRAVAGIGLAATAVAFLFTATAMQSLAAPAQEKKAPTQAQTPSQAKKIQVDVNSADQKALETLPGIGPVLAQRIIEGRPYKNLADLGKVKGLSQNRLGAIKDSVTFGTATAPATDTAKKAVPAKSATAATPAKAATPTPSASSQPSGSRQSQAASASSTTRASKSLAPGQKINVNKASAEELDRLPGIGPVKARAIVDYRNQNGDFKTIEDIQKVKGIKGGGFSKIADFIKVTD
jgi:competence protein ComEA